MRELESSPDPLLRDLRVLSTSAADAEELVVPEAWIQRSLRLKRSLGRTLAEQLTAGPVNLGRFELLEHLGEGSYGSVFQAWDHSLERTVALKLLHARSDEDHRAFQQEARSIARLRHPGLVALYETGTTEEGVDYLVTELIEGPTLAEEIQRRRLPPHAAADLVRQVAEALAVAHRAGIVHRDVKPSNIVLDERGQPHLTDFGLAKRTDESDDRDADAVHGTPAYMSPEQALGDDAAVDGRSDVFSLGVVLYELLTGERPFSGLNRLLRVQLLEDDPRPPRQLDERIPVELDNVCAMALRRERSRRYASAQEFADDLSRFLAGEAVVARTPSAWERLQRWRRKNPLAAGLFLAVSVGSAVGIAYLSYFSAGLVRDAAVTGAEAKAAMLEEFNHYYSDLIDAQGLDTTHRYRERPGTVPLPATFLTEAAKRIGRADQHGLSVRHYSDHPFPWRTDEGGPRSEFEHSALDALRAAPESPVYEFIDRDDQPFLLYATARRMTQSCIECHNRHPETPKDDWREGDVRGVLAITYPMARDIERVHSKIRGAMLWIFAVSAVLLAAAIHITLRGRPRTSVGTSEP